MQQLLASQTYNGCGNCLGKKPFYEAYPMQSLYMTELEYERDMERMKELYPSEAKKIMEYVEDECDRMEYEGSLMFDEYPDRLMLRRICDRVYDKVSDTATSEPAAEAEEQEVEEVFEQQRRRRGSRNGGLYNLIEVLLYNEMYKRRCRYKRCRRWC